MHECNLVGDFKDFGNEAPSTLAAMQTKLDQLSFNGIGKDSGFGDSRPAIGYPWQTEVWSRGSTGLRLSEFAQISEFFSFR